MKITWLPRAQRELRNAYNFIAAESPRNANAVIERIISQVSMLTEFPRMGRPGRNKGTRELVISRTPYVVAYSTTENGIEVLAVIHAARRWPDQF